MVSCRNFGAQRPISIDCYAPHLSVDLESILISRAERKTGSHLQPVDQLKIKAGRILVRSAGINVRLYRLNFLLKQEPNEIDMMGSEVKQDAPAG